MSKIEPDFSTSVRADVDVTTIGPARVVAVARLPRAPQARYDRMKRVFDLACAVPALVLAAPIIAAAAVAIRIESRGPVFFRQERMGREGRMFRIVKLRGMYADARVRFPELYDYAHSSAEASSLYFHIDNDPRVTRVGRLLRKYSLDELPNFWNVIRGEMSIVGPRPEIPEMAHVYGADLMVLLSVLPGITSPAKAQGRDLLSLAETLAADLRYIEERSLRLDVAVIARTAVVSLRGAEVRS
jgi:lipopolysaccharide/colanic/teichoic acid biosynthesis glycosyltransferase